VARTGIPNWPTQFGERERHTDEENAHGNIGILAGNFPPGIRLAFGALPEVYEEFGLYRGTPIIPLDVLSMIIQGLTLAYLYPRCHIAGSALASAFKFLCS
jgi:hypothetical protein